uniref:Uncharacterized protein n=1 Tax=Octopus bimaculoides TaxID=37653 RepID=A0A0L8GCB2_OCTBM
MKERELKEIRRNNKEMKQEKKKEIKRETVRVRIYGKGEGEVKRVKQQRKKVNHQSGRKREKERKV